MLTSFVICAPFGVVSFPCCHPRQTDPLSRLIPVDSPSPLSPFCPRHQVIAMLKEGLLTNNPDERQDMGHLQDLVTFVIHETKANLESSGRGEQAGS